jgi:gluconate 5-dehydrogenase
MMFKLTSLFDLTSRTALVTGGNSGIGLAMARALGLAGAKVALVARREAELQAAATTLSDEDIPAVPIAADLALKEAAKTVAAAAEAHDLAIDIIVNAAGINLRQPFEEVSAEAFDLHTALHLRAPFLLTQAFAPAMARRGWGRIINVASMQSWRAFPDSAPYGAGLLPDTAVRTGVQRSQTGKPPRRANRDRPEWQAGRPDGSHRVPRLRRFGIYYRTDPGGRRRLHGKIE